MKEPEVWIGVILAVVVLGGLAIIDDGAPTARVVSEPCDCQPGKAVCGALDGKVKDYASSCHAVCAGAHIVYEGPCAAMP